MGRKFRRTNKGYYKKEQYQLQCQVSANVIRPMKKKMLYYRRQYGRFPQKGDRTYMINEQLESLLKRVGQFKQENCHQKK